MVAPPLRKQSVHIVFSTAATAHSVSVLNYLLRWTKDRKMFTILRRTDSLDLTSTQLQTLHMHALFARNTETRLPCDEIFVSAVFWIFSQIKAPKETNGSALATENVLSDPTVNDSLRSARINA